MDAGKLASLLPNADLIELPILQELIATSGVEDVRFLYARLLPYFPQLSEIEHSSKEDFLNWRRMVQRCGRTLDDAKLIERANGRWTITAAGRHLVQKEKPHFEREQSHTAAAQLQHMDVQNMLVEIGQALGFYAVTEHDYYDVIWRTRPESPRLSHVFEVQRRGNIDSALAKLKRAFDAQRSKTYLIVMSERDTNRARKSIDAQRNGAFHELETAVSIVSFEQLARVHRAVHAVREILPGLCER